jgi:hypothetical protein
MFFFWNSPSLSGYWSFLSLMARFGLAGIRTGRLELDELWAFVGKKQKRTRAHETEKGDQYTFVALASTSRAIVTYRTGKRNAAPPTTSCRTFASVS